LAKRIAVVTSDVPFVEGGHLVIARELTARLREYGYESELVTTPQNSFSHVLGAYLATSLTDFSEAGDGGPIDGVVSLRFPSFAVKHERHSCWLNHRMREYYDLWPRFRKQLSWKSRIKQSLKRFLIHRIDEHCLDYRVKKLYAQSRTIQARLRAWGGHAAEVLYPPAVVRPYRTEGYGDYFFAVSRLVKLKRFELLVRAAAAAKVDCLLAGEGPEMESLRTLIGELGVEKRVRLLGRIGEEELLTHYARCRAVVFPAYGEDYGLVTLEAFSSAKPVITCSDGGGPAELVIHEKNGLVAEPETESLAEALRSLTEDAESAERMGREGLLESGRHTWQNAIEKLVEW
jgi:glycosyltransferase involved in cell wall biosynthesis